MKIRYRKSFFGLLWTLLVPAGSAAIYFIIFKFVLKVQMPHYLLFILSGIIPWTFFTSSVGGLEVLVGNYSLLNKVPLPPQALVLAESLTHFLNFVLSLPIIIGVLCFSDVSPTWALLQYPILMGLLFFTTYGLYLILSLSYVYFRDLRYLIQLILQFWFYLTPVMYAARMIPPDYAFLLYFNPIGTLFSGFHSSIVEGQWLNPGEWAAAVGWCAALNFAAWTLLKKVRYTMIEIL